MLSAGLRPFRVGPIVSMSQQPKRLPDSEQHPPDADPILVW